MPTTQTGYTPYVDDDEDESFAAGLTRDLQDQQQPQQPVPAVSVPTDVQRPVPVTVPTYTPPDRSNLQAWERQQQTDSVPISRTDPSVKPNWKDRLVAGLGTAMMTFGRVPGASEAGDAALWQRYNNAEQQRQGRLAADNAGVAAARGDIAAKDQDWERGLQSTNSQIQAGRYNAYEADRYARANRDNAQIAPESLQPDDPKNPMGSWTGKTVAGQPVKLSGPPDSWLKSPAGVAATRAKYIQDNHLTGDDAKFFQATGKLAPRFAPRQPREPSAEEIRYADWKHAFRQQYGRDPNADEMARFGKVPEGPGPKNIPPATAARINDAKNKAMKTAQDDYQAALQSAKTDKDRAAAKTDLQTALQAAQNDYEEDIQAAGGQPEHWTVGDDLQFRKEGGAASAPAPPQQQAQAGGQGDGIRVLKDSKGNRVRAKVVNNRWINADTGKPLQ